MSRDLGGDPLYDANVVSGGASTFTDDGYVGTGGSEVCSPQSTIDSDNSCRTICSYWYYATLRYILPIFTYKYLTSFLPSALAAPTAKHLAAKASLRDKISPAPTFMRSTSPTQSLESINSTGNASINQNVATSEPIDSSNLCYTVVLQDFAYHPSSQSQNHSVQHVTHHVDDEEEFPVGQEQENSHRPSILPRPSSIARHASFLDRDEAPPVSPVEPNTPNKQDKSGPVAWHDLPKKSQLAILTVARLSEPLTQTSLQAYMFYQLKSFGPSIPTATISAQAGMLQGSFTAAQFLTAMMWGQMADKESVGRKRVLLIGLVGTGISCVGFGFSRTFWQAMICRTLGGALNGNVGVMRTMISEIIKEKRFQSRAFLLLPMCFNVGMFGRTLWRFVADNGCRGHYWTNLGWVTFRSCDELSKCLWGGLVVWREEWCLLAETLALCAPKFDECGFPVLLCHCSHFWS